MLKLRLREPVMISGRDIFSRKAYIEFWPIGGIPNGWWWEYEEGEVIPIDFTIAQNRARRIVLCHKNAVLDMWDHIGSLRFTGLDGIVIKIGPGNYVPYFTNPMEYWNKLKDFCVSVCEDVKWFKIKNPVEINLDNQQGSIKVAPIKNEFEVLDVKIMVNFPELEPAETSLFFPFQSELSLEKIFSARTPGMPKWVFYLSRIFWWPHHDKVLWPYNNGDDGYGISKEIANHRLGDFLAAWSLLSHEGFVATRISSHMAGHREDIELLKKIEIV